MLVHLIGCQRISMPNYVLYQFWPRLMARAWNVWTVSEKKTSMGKIYAIETCGAIGNILWTLWTFWEHIGNRKNPKKNSPHTLRRTFKYNTWSNHWPINSTECEATVTIVWKGVYPCKTLTYFVKFLHGQTPFHTIVTLASS
jgi:hypothetical protein